MKAVAMRRAARRCSSKAAMQVMPDEDEWGRPLGVPAGLSPEDLTPKEEYWKSRFYSHTRNSTTDVAGRRALREDKLETEHYFDSNPAALEEGVDLDDVDLACKVPFPMVSQEKIVVPVYDMHKNTVGTRQLDSYTFGRAPTTSRLSDAYSHELFRKSGYGGWEKPNRKIAPGPDGQLKPHRVGTHGKGVWHHNFKHVPNVGGGAKKGSTRWVDQRRDYSQKTQSEMLREALSLKLLKERLIIVDEVKFPTASVDLVRDWANSWGFDRDRQMAYIIDGGSWDMPSQEMHKNSYWTNVFTYGIQVQELRSMNAMDIMRYHYVVLTEGALKQLGDFWRFEKASCLPPHIKNKLTVKLADLDEKEWDWASIEEEAAYEVMLEEEAMADKHDRRSDDPWLNGKRWDANEDRIKKHRKFVADNLPRLGEPIPDNIRDYWETQRVQLEPQAPVQTEYTLPWQVNNSRDTW
eukprot:TRINITY_DN13617_c0_g1_i1.p1 TRINITY_DN13617_c0_g1~~TRINITY_DN13617_c0_g1_i1.p1  ORF type:complete len:464 (+),score=102.52 TRINITY_DN13617_c0_g1_i1:44-1435(+)